VGSARTLLANRAIARCEAAWALSALGTWAFSIVFALYAYYEHGAGGVGLAVAARMVPLAAFARLPSWIGRRLPLQRAVLASALVRFATIELFALAAALEVPFVVLLVLAALFEVAGTVHRAVRAELVLETARTPGDLAALGASRIVTSVGFLAGGIAAAVVVLAVSLHAAFAITGLAFLAVTVIAWRLPVGRERAERGAPAARPTARGARTISTPPWMRLHVGLVATAVMVESTLDLLLVVAALDLLHAGDGGVGWLRAAFAGGALLAAVAASASLRAASLRTGSLAVSASVGLALAGIPLSLVAAWPSVVPAIVLIALLGGGYALLDSSLELLTQRLVTAQLAAGAGSLEGYVYPLARAIGAGVGSWLVLTVGDSTAVVVIGLLLPVVGLIAFRPLRRAERGISIPQRPLELISRLPLLAAVPGSAIETLALHARAERFEPGASLGGGERGRRLYVIDTGAVRCTAEDGTEQRLGEGDYFGGPAILHSTPGHTAITALTAVTAWAISRADFIYGLGGQGQSEPETASGTGMPLGPEPVLTRPATR
jgi:hypothetical protein